MNGLAREYMRTTSTWVSQPVVHKHTHAESGSGGDAPPTYAARKHNHPSVKHFGQQRLNNHQEHGPPALNIDEACFGEVHWGARCCGSLGIVVTELNKLTAIHPP